MLDVSPSTVIAHTKGGLLRTTRTPGGHRRYDAESVRELARVLAMPEGPWRDHELEALRLRNQAVTARQIEADQTKDDPASPEGGALNDLARYYEARGETMNSLVNRLLRAEWQRLREAGELP